MANPIKQLIKMNSAENYPVSPVKAGGGADLPTVTDADNGKVLSVNNGVWGVSPKSLLPHTQIIAPEQTVTITAEDTHGVAIALADGYTLPETLPDNWTVVVNGHILPYVHHASEGSYDYTDATQSPSVFWQVVLYEGQLWLYVAQPAQTIRPGDYTVKITKGAPARIPAVAAFPVSAGSGNVQFVIDAPKEDVDAAMVNGCVLLYAASPSISSGFAFGCLVGNVMFYATVGEEIAWFVSGVTLRYGKYVVLGEG